MMISLIGYMGCGKSHISKLLAEKTGSKLFDLDWEISLKNNMKISEIFNKKGEIYFRKEENEILNFIISTQNSGILCLGGGTPVYYDNMEKLNLYTKTVFLRASVSTLTKRLTKQKAKRPLIAKIADEELPEFISKHLLERNFYYSKAQFKIDTDEKSPEEIVAEIIKLVQ